MIFQVGDEAFTRVDPLGDMEIWISVRVIDTLDSKVPCPYHGGTEYYHVVSRTGATTSLCNEQLSDRPPTGAYVIYRFTDMN